MTESQVEKMKQLNFRLSKLLDNPQVGMASWHMALNEVMQEIHTLYYGHSPSRKT